MVDGDLAGLPAGQRVVVADDDLHHLRRVLRRGDGDPVDVTDGAGRRASGVLEGDAVVLRQQPTHTPPASPTVRVVHAVPKGRGLDEVVRTCVELGVDEVVPVVTQRCVSRPSGDRADAAVERWRAVARAATGQADRVHVMGVAPMTSLERVVDDVQARGGLGLVAHPAAGHGLATVLRDEPTRRAADHVTVVVGPEGGLTDDEVDSLVAGGFTAVHLGSTVLRSVHAATAVVAAVNALCGRYDTR